MASRYAAHGGALLRVRPANELSGDPTHPRDKKPEIKHRIGQSAARIVKSGETVFSSAVERPTLEVARSLPDDIRLTVISNSLPVINELAGRKYIELVAIGGMFRQDELSMVGHPAEQMLSEFRSDRTFIGMRAIDPHWGFTNDYMPEILTDRKILNIASQVVVVEVHTQVWAHLLNFCCTQSPPPT